MTLSQQTIQFFRGALLALLLVGPNAAAAMECDPDRGRLMFVMGLDEDIITAPGVKPYTANESGPHVEVKCLIEATVVDQISKTCADHVQKVRVSWARQTGHVDINCRPYSRLESEVGDELPDDDGDTSSETLPDDGDASSETLPDDGDTSSETLPDDGDASSGTLPDDGDATSETLPDAQ